MIEDEYKDYYNTELFDFVSLSSNCGPYLALKGTDFRFYFRSKTWEELYEACCRVYSRPVTFEKVFENCPASLQTEILFHIDMFR